jgi:hypothetical protein
MFAGYRKIEIVCPVCGFINKREANGVTLGDWGWALIECDSEEGGCGQQFVYKADAVITVQTAVIKDPEDQVVNARLEELSRTIKGTSYTDEEVEEAISQLVDMCTGAFDDASRKVLG